MEKLDLTILMPCLNEEESISICIQNAKQFLNDNQINGEILVADNGSTDNSVDIARKNNARVIKVTSKGYGNALSEGIKNAKGKYIIMADSDASYDFLNIELFYKKLTEGYDMVIGNRFKGGIAKGAMPFINKHIGNPLLSFIARKAFPCEIYDFHCGLRGAKTERLQELNLNSPGMEFASEMIIKAVIHQYKIIEIKTKLYPSLRLRKPHLRPFRDGLRHLKVIIGLRLKK